MSIVVHIDSQQIQQGPRFQQVEGLLLRALRSSIGKHKGRLIGQRDIGTHGGHRETQGPRTRTEFNHIEALPIGGVKTLFAVVLVAAAAVVIPHPLSLKEHSHNNEKQQRKSNNDNHAVDSVHHSVVADHGDHDRAALGSISTKCPDGASADNGFGGHDDGDRHGCGNGRNDHRNNPRKFGIRWERSSAPYVGSSSGHQPSSHGHGPRTAAWVFQSLLQRATTGVPR
mmetsp:Transcript_28579/g.78500  ORF Transcript_28579/g.78500 Transcript_28579/m.78500 type:complete len:227 (-) Transcript_28579:1589-2269(-)